MPEFKRVFIDTAPIIYYLENSALYMNSIKKFFAKCLEENIQGNKSFTFIYDSGSDSVDKPVSNRLNC